MRKKELKLVVTFHTTADAMAMEKACKENNTPGRIIPVPRAISAGCGLSWCAALDEREEIVAMMEKVGTLPSGGECIINKVAVDADLLLAEGFIEPGVVG